MIMNHDELIRELQAEVMTLIAKRDQADRQISGLLKAIEGLKTFAGKSMPTISMPPPPPPGFSVMETLSQGGFTDKVRAVMQTNTDKPWTPTAIRDELVAKGMENTKQLLIQVHNTIDRLEKQEEIFPEGDGYRWRTIASRLLESLLKTSPTDDVPNPFGKNLTEMMMGLPKKK